VLNLLIPAAAGDDAAGQSQFYDQDPVGLGQNFAGLMHSPITRRTSSIAASGTQRDQIDERLAELNEHIEKVIQMYLRNEFATISEYNAQAGSVAEKYHFPHRRRFPRGTLPRPRRNACKAS
jgi:hypothetical protein